MNHRSFDAKTYTRRNSNRLPFYNYRSSGAYFITMCTHKRQRVLEIPIIRIVPRCSKAGTNSRSGFQVLA